MIINIGALDSGIGGLIYLNRFKEKISSSHVKFNKVSIRMHYLADYEVFPYGNKDPEYLKQRLNRIIPQFVEKYHLDMILLACNTATVLVVKSLREILKIPVVGVVPAIKPAIELHPSKIYVMNTQLTAHSNYAKEMIDKLTKEYGVDSKIFLKGCQELVDAIENMILHEDEIYTSETSVILSKIVDEIHALDCQVVVLGCTHFLYVKSMLSKLLDKNISIIESLEGVVNRCMVIFEELFSNKIFTDIVPLKNEIPLYFHYSANKQSTQSAIDFTHVINKFNCKLQGPLYFNE